MLHRIYERTRGSRRGSYPARIGSYWIGLVCFPALLLSMAVAEPRLHEGRSFTYEDCYARWADGLLTMGNAHIRRTWKIEHGELFATSIVDLDSHVEWISEPATLPSPALQKTTPEATLVMRGGDAVFGPTEAHSLRVELAESGSVSGGSYEFQIFPQASGIRMWITRGGEGADPAGTLPGSADAIEHIHSTKQHLRFTQVTLRDRTDERNELVFENEWLLQPNEKSVELQGNLFLIEDTLTGNGLIFLKEAPQPEMRPVKTPFDAKVTGSETGLSKTVERKQTFFDLSFYGHGLEGKGTGYPSALIAYRGGREGRIAALQRYQKQLRAYVPGRDGQLLSNTWGDRSGSKKINESFIRGEIDAGQKLGVDVVQIDDGWEVGKTIASAGQNGVWEGYRASRADFWTIDRARFPQGLSPLVEYARARGMRLGLWFGPDSSEDFKLWKEDADQILAWNRTEGLAAFKFDSVKIRSKTGEANYRALTDRVIEGSAGKILLDLDVTAETRQGYFGNIAAGPLFVENRYTDWHRYWPHQTLRNLWKLSQYVDPVRLRMEFLNPERNTALYPDDPLAPAKYRADELFATAMFASPLGWFESSSLSPKFVADAAPIIAEWKKQRDAIYTGTTIPVGQAPDGVVWTGFESVADDRQSGYLLVFRELNAEATWLAPKGMFGDGNFRVRLLGGQGTVVPAKGGFEVSIPEPLGFVWVKVEAAR